MTNLHGTCVELESVGVLLRGPSGSGKSDFALRLIDAGARLVSDDQVAVVARDGQLIAGAPEPISGLMEIRGLGLVRFPHIEDIPVGLVVDLVAGGNMERLPERATVDIEGVTLPLIKVAPFEVSAVAKLRLHVHALGRNILYET